MYVASVPPVLWTQDGIAANAVPTPQSPSGNYSVNSALTDGYYCVTGEIYQDGNLRIYVPAGYTIANFYQWGLGSWTGFTPDAYTRFETAAVKVNNKDYVEYKYISVDSEFEEPEYGIAAFSFDVTKSR